MEATGGPAAKKQIVLFLKISLRQKMQKTSIPVIGC